MSLLSKEIARLVDEAPVADLTVVAEDGRPITYPMTPILQGERILLTSSVLDCRKLEHIKANSKVCLSVGGAVISADARVLEDDLHSGWEHLLPSIGKKDPSVPALLAARLAFPLISERAVIELTVKKTTVWPDGPKARESAGEPTGDRSPEVPQDLAKLAACPAAVLAWVDGEGYPLSAPVAPTLAKEGRSIHVAAPAGAAIPSGAVVAVTGSALRPGADGAPPTRSHVTAWGVATSPGSGTGRGTTSGSLTIQPDRTWSWDEASLPLPMTYEARLPRARAYYAKLSAERGRTVRPKLSTGWLFFRATRLPFLSATFAPVLLGIAVAARAGFFDLATAAVTVVAASFVHLGLNVANDVFDTLQGADDANATPTKFSGGSRVIQNGLLSVRHMSLLAAACYGVAALLGLALLAMRGSPALVAVAAVGFLISIFYTMPPIKLVYRGLGEIATAIGFGPVMLLGAYAVQTRGTLSWEAALASVPVALLVALILYVNEIPDRAGDSMVGKRTLPVRWSKAAVIRGWDVAAGLAFVAVLGGVAGGLLPVPTLLILLAVPLARRVHAGLIRFYDNPYALMGSMGENISLHMNVGALLIAGYLLAIASDRLLHFSTYLW